MSAHLDFVHALLPHGTGEVVAGGYLDVLGPDAMPERQSRRWRIVPGPYGGTLSLRTHPRGGLEVRLNPSRYCQGHGLFGSADLVPLMWTALRDGIRRIGLDVPPADLRAWERGDYRVTRVDIVRMFDCGTPERVGQFLAAAARVARIPRQRTDVVGWETIYIGKESKRLTLLLYSKSRELRGGRRYRKLPPEWREALLAYASGKIRVELRVRATQLTEWGLDHASAWTPEVADRLLDERLEKLEMNGTLRLADDVVRNLPRRAASALRLWLHGYNLREEYSRATLYRYDKELRPLGVDIFHPPPGEVVTRTEYLLNRPLKEFLAGPGVGPPECAVGTPLLALSEPTSTAA